MANPASKSEHDNSAICEGMFGSEHKVQRTEGVTQPAVATTSPTETPEISRMRPRWGCKLLIAVDEDRYRRPTAISWKQHFSISPSIRVMPCRKAVRSQSLVHGMTEQLGCSLDDLQTTIMRRRRHFD
jgi:hypothetical protein